MILLMSTLAYRSGETLRYVFQNPKRSILIPRQDYTLQVGHVLYVERFEKLSGVARILTQVNSKGLRCYHRILVL